MRVRACARARAAQLPTTFHCLTLPLRFFGPGFLITVPSLILPLPSAFFWWNVFRLWGNRKALAGAQALGAALPPGCADDTAWRKCTGPAAGECCRVQAAWKAAPGASGVVVPCEHLSTLLALPPGSGASAPALPSDAQTCGRAAAVEAALAMTGLAEHTRHVLKHHQLLLSQQ